MLGVQFNACTLFLFEVHFNDCLLDLSSFFELNLKKSSFKNCSLQQVDFSSADLSAVNFNDCNLDQAIFERSILEKTDFRTAGNYTIDLTKNKCKKAKFGKEGIAGLLQNFNIEIS